MSNDEQRYVAGHLEVGRNARGEVVLTHPRLLTDVDGVGHIVFSPAQARYLAGLLLRIADEAEKATGKEE